MIRYFGRCKIMSPRKITEMMTNWRTIALFTFLMTMAGNGMETAQIPPQPISGAAANSIRIECASESIIVHIMTSGKTNFHGLIYPKGLAKNSTCLREFKNQPSPIIYTLPLKSCNTMPTELIDGGIEYFNTVVVQPHLKLVTNQGRGFHVKCRYQTRDKIISNDQTQVDRLWSLPLRSLQNPVPGCAMKIYNGDPSKRQIAQSVRIGDPLTLVIAIEQHDYFGLTIVDCVVKDGIGVAEQKLIGNDGCPVDQDIMGPFFYNSDKSQGIVQFHAHKFPASSSVYYQCNVQLCFKDRGCRQTPPECNEILRKRRDTHKDQYPKTDHDGIPATTIEVFSGFYVNEADVVSKSDYYDVSRERAYEDMNFICMTQRSFAVGIAIASLLLLLAIIGAILILFGKRRHKSVSTTGSSIYSGPYTNTAYSHSS